MQAIGCRRWAISEGYIPSESSYSDRELVSHETACILNAGERDAHVAITIFFRRSGASRAVSRHRRRRAHVAPAL